MEDVREQGPDYMEDVREQGPDYMEDVVERSFHFSFWIVPMVRAATCGRALSWRNDTDDCALLLFFLTGFFTGPSRNAE